ncbi:hypothetical protein VIN30_00245 [Adlercreutzia sp. R7]|uniref:PABS domain-containing protein n=1 Tax=Adlercreutzia wanghongyangiae TaxID=3111451 RepID=A0ABU6IEN7_9ACTN|nr:hypothetical protein [Adlercreutzia sp. R7]
MRALLDWLNKLCGRGGRQTFSARFGEAAVYAMPAADGSLVRVLNVGGVLQSATYTDERWARCPFAYLRAFDHMFEANSLTVGRVLMIGGAGFAYPKQLLVNHPGIKLDVVEIDPAMVELAREHFFLDRLEAQLAAEGRAGDLRIFVEDGEVFLLGAVEGAPTATTLAGNAGAPDTPAEVANSDEPGAPDRYDAIINDAFVGRDAAPFFASDEGITAARACLVPDGLLMANCVVEFTGNAMYQLFAQVERLREHFANVYVIDASDEEFGGADNYLVIATDGAYPFTNVIPYGG